MRALKVLFGALAILSVTAWALPPHWITIAVIDSPVDHDHETFANAVDQEMMDSIKVVDRNGKEKSWSELNREVLAEFKKRIDQGRYAEHVAFIDAVAQTSNGVSKNEPDATRLKILLKGMIKAKFSKKFRQELDLIGTYLHGTHVSGVAMQSLTGVKLITYPMITPSEKMTIREIWKFNEAQTRAELRTKFAAIGEGLRKAGTRVVNLSLGSSDDVATKAISKNMSLITKLLTLGKRGQVARAAAKIYVEEMGAMFKANPDMIFVMASGNEMTELTKYKAEGKNHTALIQMPNVLQVASANEAGSIDKFSNTSGVEVEVAAPGAGIKNARAGGGQIHMTGTSMAAPAVTNRLAEILVTNPEFTVEQTLAKFYSDHTWVSPALAGLTIDGRMMSANPANLAEKITHVGDTDREDLRRILIEELRKFSGEDIPAFRVTFKSKDVVVARFELVRTQEGDYYARQLTVDGKCLAPLQAGI